MHCCACNSSAAAGGPTGRKHRAHAMPSALLQALTRRSRVQLSNPLHQAATGRVPETRGMRAINMSDTSAPSHPKPSIVSPPEQGTGNRGGST